MKTRADDGTTSAFDINREGLLPIAAIPDYLESLGACRPHMSTIYRWLSSGVGGRRLATVRVGGRTYTSKAALARFATQLPEEGGCHAGSR